MTVVDCSSSAVFPVFLSQNITQRVEYYIIYVQKIGAVTKIRPGCNPGFTRMLTVTKFISF